MYLNIWSSCRVYGIFPTICIKLLGKKIVVCIYIILYTDVKNNKVNLYYTKNCVYFKILSILLCEVYA